MASRTGWLASSLSTPGSSPSQRSRRPPDRQFFQDLRPVDQLMEEMSADPAMETEVTPNDTLVAFASQGTKRQHPFDSQEELDQEVESEDQPH